MDNTLTTTNEGLRKAHGTARGPLGMKFTQEPSGTPKRDPLELLDEFFKKHPPRKLRPGEKGAVAQLRETRDRR